VGFQLDDFARCRPWLYHVTPATNVPSIREVRQLHCAGHWLGRDPRWRERRSKDTRIGAVTLVDQARLFERNVALAPGFEFGDLVALLNAHVFFWPGDARGPIRYGQSYVERYRDAARAIIRVSTNTLLEHASSSPAFCRFNSGAGRCSGGRRSPRGPDTFIPAAEFDRAPSKVVEVVFRGVVRLPDETRWRTLDGAEWMSL
jgi:hypothetical protein